MIEGGNLAIHPVSLNSIFDEISWNTPMSSTPVTLSRGVHVAHLFFRLDRVRWQSLPAGASAAALARLEAVCAKYPGPAAPRVMTFAGVGGKADVAVLLFSAELQELSRLQREVEQAFPPGTLVPVYSYLSITELPEYVATDDDLKAILARDGVVPRAAALRRALCRGPEAEC